jgi:hypothetical protein
MSKTSLKFKVQSLKAVVPATLNFKLCTALNWRSLAFIGGLVFSFIAVPVLADTPQPDIRDLDRMFTTRYERAQLDELRRRMRGGTGTELPASATAIILPLTVEMQGIMQREKGKNITWINGQSTARSNSIDERIHVNGNPHALRGARVTIDGKTIRLKPGQVWQQEDNKIVESYTTKVAIPATNGAADTSTEAQTDNSVNKVKEALEIIDAQNKELKQIKP